MKFFLFFLFSLIVTCSILSATAFEDIEIDVYGETNFSKEKSESFKTFLYLNTKHKVYEPHHKRWVIVFNNIVNPDLDHFHNEIKVNVFTTIGIDF